MELLKGLAQKVIFYNVYLSVHLTQKALRNPSVMIVKGRSNKKESQKLGLGLSNKWK